MSSEIYQAGQLNGIVLKAAIRLGVETHDYKISGKPVAVKHEYSNEYPQGVTTIEMLGLDEIEIPSDWPVEVFR